MLSEQPLQEIVSPINMEDIEGQIINYKHLKTKMVGAVFVGQRQVPDVMLLLVLPENESSEGKTRDGWWAGIKARSNFIYMF